MQQRAERNSMQDVWNYQSPRDEEAKGPRGNLFMQSFGKGTIKSKEEILVTKTSAMKEDVMSDYDNYL